jgi:hypothetical protein
VPTRQFTKCVLTSGRGTTIFVGGRAFLKEGDTMKGSKLMTMWRRAILAIGLTASLAMAAEPILKNVVVNFGAGLNTEGGANNRIIRRQIEVRQGGVVNFVVSGFHQVFVYQRGIQPDDFDPNACSDTFVNQRLDQTLYQGISPVENQNRVEAVYFGEPGTYLVICNVCGHFFEDKMFAFVKVLQPSN